MSADAYIEMVYRNLKGDLSPDEFKALNILTAKDSELAKMRMEIEDAWDMSGEEVKIVQKDETAALLDKLKVEKKKATVFSLSRVVSGIAAILILVMGAIWLMDRGLTTYDEAGLIRLADGSMVELREGSRLKVYSFEENERKVLLKGEAFFDVMEDTNKPFIVETQRASVTVLGTSFLVKELNESVYVDLLEGRVNFAGKDGSNSMDLVPGMKAVYNLKDGVKEVYYRNLNAWKDGLFEFRDVPLLDAIKEIEMVYSTTIYLQNQELSNCPINAILTAENIELTLNQVASQLKMNVEQRENEWVLSNGACK